MPAITMIKTGNHATGVKVQTQFDMESSEKLFEITGPKTLEWKYNVTSAKLQEHGADIVDEHVQKVKTYLEQNWRSKFKKNVKTQVVKEMKALEKVYKTKSEGAKKDIKDHFSKAASEKAERIIKEEFETFMDGVSNTCLRQMGKKASKLKQASKKVLIGAGVIAVSVVGIASAIASVGAAAIPALTATGAAIAILTTSGTVVKTFKAARKEFRDAQSKLSKSKAKALDAVQVALDDAKNLKGKYDQMVLRQNNMGTKIEKLDAEVAALQSIKIDEPKAKKMAKEAKELNDELKKDLEKLEKLASNDPKYMVTALETVLKKIKDDVDIEERIAQQGRMDGAFGAVNRANALANGIAGLVR